MKSKTIEYYIPVKVKFTSKQMSQIIDNLLNHWGIERNKGTSADDFAKGDILEAAERLNLIELPPDWRY